MRLQLKEDTGSKNYEQSVRDCEIISVNLLSMVIFLLEFLIKFKSSLYKQYTLRFKKCQVLLLTSEGVFFRVSNPIMAFFLHTLYKIRRKLFPNFSLVATTF